MSGESGAGVAGDPNRYVEAKLKIVVTEVANLDAVIETLRKKVQGVLDIINEAGEKVSNLGVGTVTTNQAQTTTEGAASERDAKQLDKMQKYLGTIADVGVGFIKKTFNLVEMVFAQLKKSSPLLQAIEQLFNLAWMLFFMPLGNKLGEMLIPAVIQLMDDVMEIWDSFEGKSLDEMFTIAITKGVNILGDWISNIGETLSGQKNFVGAIGSMLTFIGDFVRGHGAQLLNTIAGVAQFILEHLKEILAVIIAFKAASLAMSVAQIYATYASAATIDNFFTAGASGALTGFGKTVLTIGAVGAIAGGLSYGLMNYAGPHANGGHIDATPGGSLVTVGEGGEGEWIIPDSKMEQFGSKTINVNIQCCSVEEVKSVVKEVISDEVSMSRLRGGF